MHKKLKNNNRNTSSREFHLLDFPDNVYVLIKDKFRKRLFKQIYSKFGNKTKTAKKLDISLRTLLNYERGFSIKYRVKHSQLIPIKFLKKIVSFEEQCSLEKNISAISVRNGLRVKNPKLPIKECPELYSIIGHMIADGCQSTHHVPYYANSDKTLREKFIEKLLIFGDFKVKEKKTKTTTIIEFPKVITDIIQYLFYFQITHPNRIPKRLFSSSKECKSSFIGALFDDDGSFSTSIVLTIHNFNLITQVKKLSESLNLKTNKISVFKYSHKKNKVGLQISSKSIEDFYNLIPIECPHKKLNLEYKVKIKKRNKEERTRNPILIEEKILKLLEIKPSKTIEIANHLLFTISSVLRHLNRLEKEGIVIEKGFKNKKEWDLA